MVLTVDGDVIEVTESDPVAVAARLRQLEAQIPGMSAEQVKTAGAEMRVVQSWLSAYLGKLTVRASALQAQGQPADARDVAAEAGLAPREATKAARRGKAMQQMPEAREALEDGEIGVGHADVLARHADRLSGRERRAFEGETEQLVADAVRDGVSIPEFEQRCRKVADRLMGDDGIAELEQQRRNSRASEFTDSDTGMKGVHGNGIPSGAKRSIGPSTPKSRPASPPAPRPSPIGNAPWSRPKPSTR